MRIRAAPLLVLAASLAIAAPAMAQEDAKTKARRLFGEGAQAVEQGRPAEGLPKLEEAEALFHAPTHLLYIARAQAKLGKLIEARATYKKLADEQLPPKASDPFKQAQAAGRAELPEIEKRIPVLTVRVDPPNAPGLVVFVDDTDVGVSGGAVAPKEINPGGHTVVVRAGGYKESKTTVDVAEGRTTEIAVALELVKSGGGPVAPPPDDGGGWSAAQIAGVPMMAVGGAGLVAGGVLGVLSLLKTSEADDQFETCGLPCKNEIDDLDQEAATFGTGAIIALAAGAAVLTTGVVLFAVGGSDDPAAPASGAASGSTTLLVSPGFVGLERRF
jgi:hypothetical protein